MKFLKIYEEFDPILKSDIQIATICKEYGINNWSINYEGLVDVGGNVDLYRKGLTKLPLRFGRIDGSFYCNFNNLTTLEGAPSYVEDGFYCNGNSLTTLEGGPKYVGGNYECDNNKLTSFVGAPEIVGGDFYCNDNKLTSFVGAPEIINGEFFCRNNHLNSFEGFPKSVGGLQCSGKADVSSIYAVWKLFLSTEKIELFNEFDIIRGRDLVLDRLNDFLVTIGKKPVENVEGYNNI